MEGIDKSRSELETTGLQSMIDLTGQEMFQPKKEESGTLVALPSPSTASASNEPIAKRVRIYEHNEGPAGVMPAIAEEEPAIIHDEPNEPIPESVEPIDMTGITTLDTETVLGKRG